MKKMLALIVSSAFFLSACAPSLQYQLGEGFYSEQFDKKQVQALANAGKVQDLGRFSVESRACLNFSQDMTDHNIVIPAVREGLEEWNGNVADQIMAKELWCETILIYVLVGGVPMVLGCRNLTVSGEAIKVTP